MDAVAGKLPKDEQSPPYKNIARGQGEASSKDYRWLPSERATSVPYRFIRNELVHKYHIENAATALFFRNQLKEYETEGGNKNKAIVLQN